MAQKGFMRTIEETRAHIKALHDEIENGDVRARHNGPNCPGCLYSLLEFIDSEPPCKHEKAFYKPSGFYGHGGRWYFAGVGLDPAFEIFCCPDCGERLPEDGVKEEA